MRPAACIAIDGAGELAAALEEGQARALDAAIVVWDHDLALHFLPAAAFVRLGGITAVITTGD